MEIEVFDELTQVFLFGMLFGGFGVVFFSALMEIIPLIHCLIEKITLKNSINRIRLQKMKENIVKKD